MSPTDINEMSLHFNVSPFIGRKHK